MGLTLLRAAIALAVILIVTSCSGAGLQTRDDVPAGVDPQVWAKLTACLDLELGKRASATNFQPHLPLNGMATIDDLAVKPLVDGYMLEWTYKNPGDYNQDGEVNLADLAVVGRYLNADSTSPNWISARCADGNGDGSVKISDITPLAHNWRGSVGGYLIAPDLGDGTGDGFISIPDLTPFGRLLAADENGVENIHPRLEVDNTFPFPTFTGPEGDDLFTVVEPGTPGLPGAWNGVFLFPTSKGQASESGKKRFGYHLSLSVDTDFRNWTVGVVPAFDSGERYHDPNLSEDQFAVYWDWSTVGELSNLVTLPGVLY